MGHQFCTVRVCISLWTTYFDVTLLAPFDRRLFHGLVHLWFINWKEEGGAGNLVIHPTPTIYSGLFLISHLSVSVSSRYFDLSQWSVNFRSMFENQCYIHFRWSCFQIRCSPLHIYKQNQSKYAGSGWPNIIKIFSKANVHQLSEMRTFLYVFNNTSIGYILLAIRREAIKSPFESI